MPAAGDTPAAVHGCAPELSGIVCGGGLRWREQQQRQRQQRKSVWAGALSGRHHDWRAAMFGLLSKAGGGGGGGGRERSGTGGRKGALTVFGNDGTVLEYHRRVRCSEVLASHPNHLVCPANAVKQQGGMLTAGEFLELGRVYFLLPNPACVVEEDEEDGEQSSSGPAARSAQQQQQEQRQQVVAGPVQFVISKAQLTQILGEATRAAGCAQTPGRKPVRASRRSRSKQQHWVASLESIPEYVAI